MSVMYGVGSRDFKLIMPRKYISRIQSSGAGRRVSGPIRVRNPVGRGCERWRIASLSWIALAKHGTSRTRSRTTGFDPAQFQFGLGPDRIKPINNPEFLSPGDSGYPSPEQTFRVIGTTIDGDSRAYPIGVLNSHEIVNDVFGDAHVTIGW